MTWSPRNGRGEDSDDDDIGNDDTLELSTNDFKPSNVDIKNEFKTESDVESPKKTNKIWSIADAINPRTDSASSNISSKSTNEKLNLPAITPSTASLIGQTTTSSSSSSTSSTQIPPTNFSNPMLMQAMAANRLPMPQQIYAFMQQQAQAAQAQQAAAAIQQQQQLAVAMLRNAGNLPPMFFNNLFMPGMNGLSTLSTQHQPSTSSHPSSPSPTEAANTSDCGRFLHFY